MREHVIKLYQFDELNEDAKKIAIEEFRKNMDLSNEADFITEDFAYELKELGYPIDDIEWRLSYSQGDGVAFYGKVEDMDKVVKRLANDEGYSIDINLYNKIIEEGFVINAKICRNSFGYHYSHYNTMEVEMSYDYIETIIEDLYPNLDISSDEYVKKFNEIENLIDNIQSAISSDIKNVSKKLEKDGYESLEYYTSDEYITELISESDYEYTEDGKMYF